MKTTVSIEWDLPEEHKAGFVQKNISVALHAYCKNTKFKVSNQDTLEAKCAWQAEMIERARIQISAFRDPWLYGVEPNQ